MIDDGLGNLVLDHEGFSGPPIVASAPQLSAGRDVHELGGDVELIGRLRKAAKKHGVDAKLAPNRAGIDRLSFQRENGATSHHLQR